MKKWLVWLCIACLSISTCHASNDYSDGTEYGGGWNDEKLKDLRSEQKYFSSQQLRWNTIDWLPYERTDRPFRGSVCWQLDCLTNPTAEGYIGAGRKEYSRVLKTVHLKTADVEEVPFETGYIIQKNPDEFDGVLYAIDDDDAVEIWHRRPDGEAEFIRRYLISAYYYTFRIPMGTQTVRAYMNGSLYYISVLEDTGITLYNNLGERKAELCRLDEDGNTESYALNDWQINRYGHVNSLIDCYAIAPQGAVAWTSGETYESNEDNLAYDDISRELWVEFPGEDAQCILTQEDLRKMNYNAVDGRFLCWIDENTLLFAMYLQPFYGHQLYTIDVRTKRCAPCLTRRKRPVMVWHEVSWGTTVVYLAGQNAVAFIGLPNGFTQTVITDINEMLVAVPQVIDLDTGENYVLYENATWFDDYPLEFRHQSGQLTWMNQAS